MENTYTKLSALVNDTFRIEKVWGYRWKKWDNDNKKMLVSDKYEQGFRKVYEVDTSKGKLDLGSGQLGSLLEAVFKNGVADLNNKTFSVKSNGKTGMDIRYFFNHLVTTPLPDTELNGNNKEEDKEEEFNLDDIPF